MEKCSLNFVKTSITDVYSLKATFVPSGDIDNAWFSNFFCGYRNETLIWNRSKKFHNITQMVQNEGGKEERPSAF